MRYDCYVYEKTLNTSKRLYHGILKILFKSEIHFTNLLEYKNTEKKRLINEQHKQLEDLH
jgi:hypothetical protein